METKLVPQKTAPRYDRGAGVDYGANGKILIEKGGVWLVWRSGSNCWHGMGGTQYHPVQMQVQNIPGERISRTIHEGGRLSKRLIRSLTGIIDEHFGEGAASKVSPSHTLVIVEREAKEGS